MANVAEDLLTTVDAAAVLGRSPKTIARWVNEGRLEPAQKLPGLRGAMLFDRVEVERLAFAMGRDTDDAA